MKKFISFLVAVLTTVVLTSLAISCTSGQGPISKAVVKAILAEKWEEVANLLPAEKTDSSPVAKFIKGHALLALNKNNESLCMFLAASTEPGLQEWEAWTKYFVQRHAKNAIAHYFYGDALARLENWDATLQQFSDALKIKQGHSLVLNAEAVVHAAKKEWDKSISDLEQAIKENSSLADAYANLGFLAILQSEGAKGALLDFDKALQLSPSFSVALYGRGCVKSILTKWEEAQDDFLKALGQGECFKALIAVNIVEMLQHMEANQRIEITADEETNPSMEIQRRFDTINKNENFGLMGVDLKKIVAMGERHVELRPMIEQGMRDLYTNPKIAGQLDKALPTLAGRNDWGARLAGSMPETKMETSLRGTIAGIGPGVVASVSGEKKLTMDFSKPLSEVKTMNENRSNYLHGLMNTMPKNPASGFKTSLEEANWDEGDWPFKTICGLSYRVISIDPKSKEK